MQTPEINPDTDSGIPNWKHVDLNPDDVNRVNRDGTCYIFMYELQTSF